MKTHVRGAATRARSHPHLVLAAAIIASVAAGFFAASLPAIRETVGWLPGALAPLAGWVALFRDDAKRLLAEVVARTLHWTRRGERLAVAARLEADFDQAIGTVAREAPGATSRKLRIEWHRGDPDARDLGEGEVVVRLKDHRERKSNLVTVALAHATRGTLRQARPFLDPNVSRAADFVVARALLRQIDERAADVLVQEVCTPECRGSQDLATLVEQAQTLDDRGMFTRIALREFVALGGRLHGQLPNGAAAAETVDFMGYLNRIATKAPYQDLDEELGFRGAFIRTGIVLVARPAVYAIHGTAAYTRRVGRYVAEGITVVYLAARGTNVEFARTVASDLQGHGNVSSIDEHEFDLEVAGTVRPTYVARVVLNPWLSRRAERRFRALRPAPSERAVGA